MMHGLHDDDEGNGDGTRAQVSTPCLPACPLTHRALQVNHHCDAIPIIASIRPFHNSTRQQFATATSSVIQPSSSSLCSMAGSPSYPSSRWVPGAPPSVHSYHVGYRHPYPPPLPNGSQKNMDNQPPNSPILPPYGSNAPHQHGFGGEHPAWRYGYPERHADLPNQYPYAERRPGPGLFGPGVNPYDHFGPYPEPPYSRDPYGYALGTHPPPPTLHTSHGNHPPNVSFGANIPPERVDRHPSINAKGLESSGVEMEHGRTKEG